MALELSDLDKVLQLSSLSIPEAEKTAYLGQLQAVLADMDRLNALDLTTVDPSSWATDEPMELREDSPVKWDNKSLESNAPQWIDGCFSVPKILE